MNITEACERFGKRRLAVHAHIASREDWKRKWPKPAHAYPFKWGDCWQAVIEFGVKDFAAELGFYLDILGMKMNAIWDDHAMIMTPDGEYAFTIFKAKITTRGMNLQFMIGNIVAAVRQLKRRGVTVKQDLKAEWGEQSPMRTFRMSTPNGHVITLWGMVKVKTKKAKRPSATRTLKDGH